MPKRLSENEIEMRVCATRMRWPESGTTIAWSRLHEAVDALQGLVQTVDQHCAEAEQNQDFSAAGITRRRSELARQALKELTNFKPFQIAEKAALENISYLEQRMVDLPQQPTNVADVALAQEIRQFIRGQKSPIDAAVKGMPDPRIVGAILNAPAVLSGLSEAEFNLVRERTRTALHPEQTRMQQLLAKALDELREGVGATKRAVLERCRLAEVSRPSTPDTEA